MKHLIKQVARLVSLPNLLLTALLALAGCQNSLETPEQVSGGNVVINIGGGAARTLSPMDTDLNGLSYQLTFSGSGGAVHDAETVTLGQAKTVSLVPGSWTITAQAITGNTVKAEGIWTGTVSAGETTNVSITLLPKTGSGNGTFAYTVTFPDLGASGSKSLALYAVTEGGSETTAAGTPVTDFTSGSSRTVSLPAGFYRLSLRLADSAGNIAAKTEAVHIYAGFTTTGTFNFAENEWSPDDPDMTAPISVQQALRNAQITQVTSPQFRTAVYDEDLKCVLLAYKVGTIENMFLQYLSNPVVARPGTTIGYSQATTNSVTEQTEHMNMTTTTISGNVKFAFAGASASASAAAIALPVAAGATAQAKASAYGVKGGISFDYNSVTKSTYTETYTSSMTFTTIMTSDLSPYPAGKSYAIAAFADVGVYQFLKYDIESKTATAIPGKSMWFNVEEKPSWDLCEYNRDEELSLPNKLTPFERLSVQVNEADLYKALKTTHTETRTTDLTTPDNNSNSKDEIVSPTLIVPLLKHFGYNNVKIDVSFRYKAESISGGKLRLQIANAGKSAELKRVEVTNLVFDTAWHDGSGSVTTGIDSLNSAEGVFMLLWSKAGVSKYCVGRRTITITAFK